MKSVYECMYNNNSIIIIYIIFNTFVHHLSCRLKALPGELHDSVLASLLGWYSNQVRFKMPHFTCAESKCK